MALPIWQILLIVAVVFLQEIEGLTTGTAISAPILIGTVVGAIVGDLKLGLIIGSTLQLMILGVGAYGGASVPDMNTAAVIGTVFAAISGKGAQFGVSVAVPVGLLMVQLDVLGRFCNLYFQHRVDRAIERMDFGAIQRNVIYGVLPWGLSRAVPVFIMLFFGKTVVNVLVNQLPDWLMGGLKVSGGILPVVGVAILLRFLPTKKFIAFLMIGFFAAAYLKVPMLGVTILGLAMALIYFRSKGTGVVKPQTVTAAAESDVIEDGGSGDDEYEEE